MPECKSTIVDVYVFRRRQHGAVEFLQLQRRPDSSFAAGTWQAVHGGIEPGESAVETALRELHEETGLTPLRFWQLEYVNTFYVAKLDAILMCPCFAAEVPADAPVQWNEEHVAARWVAAADADQAFLWPGQRTALAEIRTFILQPSQAEPLLRIPLDDRGRALS